LLRSPFLNDYGCDAHLNESAKPLLQCEDHCRDYKACGDGLICHRPTDGSVPGCFRGQEPNNEHKYCVPPIVTTGFNNNTLYNQCDDSHPCRDGLECTIVKLDFTNLNQQAFDAVPGCTVNNPSQYTTCTKYCTRPFLKESPSGQKRNLKLCELGCKKVKHCLAPNGCVKRDGNEDVTLCNLGNK